MGVYVTRGGLLSEINAVDFEDKSCRLGAFDWNRGYNTGMAAITSTTVRLSPLGKRKIAKLAAKAKDLGMTPEQYARQLIEDGLAVQRDAETMSFAEIMSPVRKAAGGIEDAGIVELVNEVRHDLRRSRIRDKKR
jgi:hypothetical protein